MSVWAWCQSWLGQIKCVTAAVSSDQQAMRIMKEDRRRLGPSEPLNAVWAESLI